MLFSILVFMIKIDSDKAIKVNMIILIIVILNQLSLLYAIPKGSRLSALKKNVIQLNTIIPIHSRNSYLSYV